MNCLVLLLGITVLTTPRIPIHVALAASKDGALIRRSLRQYLLVIAPGVAGVNWRCPCDQLSRGLPWSFKCEGLVGGRQRTVGPEGGDLVGRHSVEVLTR